MTVDAIRLASSVDAIVIVSGDGDFIPLVEYLKFNSGCQVEVATFKSTAAVGLIEVCDDFLDLSENLERYLISRKKNFKYGSSFKNNFNFRPKNNFTKDEKKQIHEGVEIESPEMIFERTSGKRGIPQNKNNISKGKIPVKKNNEFTIKKATEVEIKRVKIEDVIVVKKEKLKKVEKKPIKKFIKNKKAVKKENKKPVIKKKVSRGKNHTIKIEKK